MTNKDDYIGYSERCPYHNRPFPVGIGACTDYMIPWYYPSPYLRQHLDQFILFCRAHCCDQQTHTDYATFITIGRIYYMLCQHAVLPDNNSNFTVYIAPVRKVDEGTCSGTLAMCQLYRYELWPFCS